jgi:hypothetical protein
MDKYFLMGFDSVKSFEEFGVSGLLDEKGQDGFTIIKYNERTSLLKDLMDAVLGWDCYVEIFYEDIKEIEIEKNRRNWMEFFAMLDPDANKSDGEVMDYMMKYYRVPEFIHLDQL